MKNNKGRGAVSDGFDTNRSEQPERKIRRDAKTLIIYFSRSGNTEQQAKTAQTELSADIYELVVDPPYPATYSEAVSRATKERESKNWPQLILDDLPNLSQYSLVLLGHPIWAMTIANPMRQFLEQYAIELSQKKVASFSTNAGYGSGETQRLLQKLLPTTTEVLSNYTVEDINLEQTQKQFISWLTKL